MSVINAEKYLNETNDAGVALNNLWADCVHGWEGGNKIIIPPGTYNVFTPIVWMGANFVLEAEQVALNFSFGLSKSIFSFGCDSVQKHQAGMVHDCMIRGLQITNAGLGKNISGIDFVNTNNCILDHVQIYSCDTAFVHHCDKDYYSYFNILQNCRAVNCDHAILQDGDQATGLKVDRFDATCKDTFFDLNGSNTLSDVSCQSLVHDCYIAKFRGNNNYLHLAYHEGQPPYPYKMRIQDMGKNNRVDTLRSDVWVSDFQAETNVSLIIERVGK